MRKKERKNSALSVSVGHTPQGLTKRIEASQHACGVTTGDGEVKVLEQLSNPRRQHLTHWQGDTLTITRN